MSIAPGLVAAAIGLFAALVIANIILLIRLGAGRRRGSDPIGPPLERISSRLEQLDRLSGNVEELSRVFLVPHARGGLGETLLEELLHTWLPRKAYRLQYGFADGVRADAVVLLGDVLVAVDAKFPLEQVRSILESDPSKGIPGPARRAFLKHIESIAGKYIRPSEGTLDFALMYIPSEALYYRGFVDSDDTLMEEAVARGVVPVGPGSLFLYLQTVAFGLRGLSLSGRDRETTELVQQLNRDFGDLAKTLETTSGHLRNAERNASDLAGMFRRYESLLRRLSGATESESGSNG